MIYGRRNIFPLSGASGKIDAYLAGRRQCVPALLTAAIAHRAGICRVSGHCPDWHDQPAAARREKQRGHQKWRKSARIAPLDIASIGVLSASSHRHLLI